MTGKRKFTFDLLQSMFNEFNATLSKDYSSEYLTRDSRIIGNCILCENTFNKSFDKLYKNKNFGCEICSKKIKTEKIKKTNFERYGVEHAAQLEIFKEKMKSTTLERHGVEHALQNDKIKQKIKETNLKKYGKEYGLQNRNVRDKIKSTMINRYGVEHNLHRTDIKEKIKKTNLERYGVEYVCQCSEIMEKSTKNMYKSKEYVFPSGKTITIQGYENFALDFLIEQGICEIEIVTGCKNVPTIWYYDKNNVKRRHFVDIYIPSQNKCIEVKSTWTSKLHDGNIQLKQKYGKDLGYDYEIWIYNDKGIRVECIT